MRLCISPKIMDKYFGDILKDLWKSLLEESRKYGYSKGEEVSKQGKIAYEYKEFYRDIVLALQDEIIDFDGAQAKAYNNRDLMKWLFRIYNRILETPEMLERAKKLPQGYEQRFSNRKIDKDAAAMHTCYGMALDEWIKERLKDMNEVMNEPPRVGRPRKYSKDEAQERSMARMHERKRKGLLVN